MTNLDQKDEFSLHAEAMIALVDHGNPREAEEILEQGLKIFPESLLLNKEMCKLIGLFRVAKKNKIPDDFLVDVSTQVIKKEVITIRGTKLRYLFHSDKDGTLMEKIDTNNL